MHLIQCSIQAGQFLNPTSRSYDLASFLVQNLSLVAYILLGWLLVVLTTTIWAKLTRSILNFRRENPKLFLFRVPFIGSSRLQLVHLKLIFWSFSLFLFLNLQLLSSTIQTEKVTVPTDEIVDSPVKLISTSKTLTVGQGGLLMIKQAPTNSFLGRLSSKEFFELSMKKLGHMKTNIDRYVFLGDEVGLSQLIGLLSRHAHSVGMVAFRNPTVYYETLLGFKMRRNLKAKLRKFINEG